MNVALAPALALGFGPLEMGPRPLDLIQDAGSSPRVHFGNDLFRRLAAAVKVATFVRRQRISFHAHHRFS